MTKQEFAQNYLPIEQQRMAIAMLEDGDRSKAEWDLIWRKKLNSPTR